MFRRFLTIFFVAALATGAYALPALANHHESGGGHEGHEGHPPAGKSEDEEKNEHEGDHGDHHEGHEGMGDDHKGGHGSK